MRLRGGLLASLVLASAGSLVAPAARADGPSDLEAALAEPVVTTASQTAEDQSTAPATSTTITADELRRYGIKTLAEALNFLSLGMVTQGTLDDVEIGGRGVLLTTDYNDHVLLLIDGHSVNEAWGGTAYFGRGAGVPFELIDHIEVILGPGSVLYGSQAMLGVINIVTKRAKDFAGFRFVAEADLFTSARGAVGFGHEFTLLGKRAELTYEMEYYGQHGPAFTLGPQNNGVDYTTGKGTCYDASCAHPGIWGGTPADRGYWTQLPDGYLRLLWGDFELDVHAESYQRASPALAYVGYNVPNEYEIDRYLSADLRHRWAISPLAQLRSRVYADSYTYRQQLPSYAGSDCYGGQTAGCIYEGLGYSRWAGLEEQLTLDWLHDQSLTTLLGVDGRAIRLGEENYATTGSTTLSGGPAPFGVFDHSEYRVAGYGQQTWRPLSWLSLNGGARIDDDLRPDQGVQYGRVSPRGVLALNPWRGATLKVIYSEAFRAPTYFESSFTDHQTVIPNLSLAPESVRSGEVSFEQRVGTQRFFVGGFDAQYTGMVLQSNAPTAQLVRAARDGGLNPVTPNTTQNIIKSYGPGGTAASVQQYQNLSGISDVGVNAAFEGTALGRDLRYGLNVTWAYSRQTQPNPGPPGANGEPGPCPGTSGKPETTCTLPVTVTPEVFGNARVSYDLPGEWPVLGVAASLVGKRPASTAFSAGWTPIPYAPTQVELRGTISGPVPKVPGLSYRFIVNYAVSGVNPYVIGPVNAPTKANPQPELVPVDQLRTTVGLEYALP